MSDKALMPTPDVIYASGNALTRYRAAFTSLQVFQCATNGRRIEINDDGHRIVFELSAAQAKDLASLLMPAEGMKRCG